MTGNQPGHLIEVHPASHTAAMPHLRPWPPAMACGALVAADAFYQVLPGLGDSVFDFAGSG
jgi:hypothetical protein